MIIGIIAKYPLVIYSYMTELERLSHMNIREQNAMLFSYFVFMTVKQNVSVRIEQYIFFLACYGTDRCGVVFYLCIPKKYYSICQ